MTSGSSEANSIALLTGRLVTAITTFAVAVMAAQNLGEDFGQVAAVIGAGFIISTALAFGTDTLIVRATARDPHGTGSAVAAPALALQLAAGAVLAATALFAYLIGVASSAVAIQAAVLLPQAVVMVGSAVLRGRDEMRRFVFSTAAGGVVAVVATAILLNNTAAVWVPIAALGIGRVVSAALVAAAARTRPRLPASTHEVRSLVTATSAFAVMVTATTISGHIALVILGGLGIVGAAGFAAASQFVDAAKIIPAATYSAAFPAMADRMHRRPSEIGNQRRLLYVAVAATILLIATAGPLVEATFGDLDRGPEVLRILALGIVPIVLRQRFSFEMIANGQERYVARAAAAVALFILIGTLVVVSAGSTGSGPSSGTSSAPRSDGTMVIVVAWLHTIAIVLNVVVLDRFNRRPPAAPVVARRSASVRRDDERPG